jgi:type IV secretory pathway TrbD component
MGQNDEAADGFEIPLYVALTQRVLIAGIPRSYFYIIGTVCLALSLPMQAPLVGIPLWFVLYLPAMYLTQLDPYFIPVFLRSVKHALFTGRDGVLEG